MPSVEAHTHNYVPKNAAITAATKCKITYNANGLVTAGANLAASDIPNLDASKITSGIFADARIPNLGAGKITSGTLGIARGGTGQATVLGARKALGVGYSATGARQQLTATKLECIASGHYVLEVQLTISGETTTSYVPFVHPGTASTLKVIVPQGTTSTNETMNVCLTLSTTAKQVSLSSISIPALANASASYYTVKVYIW
jgi:hypothetical protein